MFFAVLCFITVRVVLVNMKCCAFACVLNTHTPLTHHTQGLHCANVQRKRQMLQDEGVRFEGDKVGSAGG